MYSWVLYVDLRPGEPRQWEGSDVRAAQLGKSRPPLWRLIVSAFFGSHGQFSALGEVHDQNKALELEADETRHLKLHSDIFNRK